MGDKLTVNKEYAARFAKRKQAEELSRLREKYGDHHLVETESESSTSEDEDAEGVSVQVEKDFLRTLSLVRRKDPQIYNKNTRFYSEEGGANLGGDEQRKPQKPLYLRDYERQRLLERGSMAEVSDSENEGVRRKPTYTEEQNMLKEGFQRAVEEAELSDSEDVLKPRAKTQEEKEEEEREYAQWLRGRTARVDSQDAKDLAALRHYWTAPDLDPGEAFLRDYILNRGYIDKDAVRVPTYEEVVGSSGEESEDEKALESQEKFERSFNFRFEEPDGDLIASYPRTVMGSVRREDERRKKKRKQREERKAKENEQRKEELKRLKNLKKKEILERLERLRKVTGDTALQLSAKDVDGDFDPTSHDAAMQRAFGEQYYTDQDSEKPVFSDSEEDDGSVDWDQWPTGEEGPHCEDPDFNMDADYQEGVAQEGAGQEKVARKRKRTSRLAAAVRRKKPNFDPSKGTFEEYFDEYYQLDYEDMIGDLPCRFHYRSVVPNDFGLSTEEILTCDDKELNRWVTLKKTGQYRTEEEEIRDRRRYRKKARNLQKKYQILTSLRDQLAGQEEAEGTKQQRKKAASDMVMPPTGEGLTKQKPRLKKKWKVKARTAYAANGSTVPRQVKGKHRMRMRTLSHARLRSYGLAKKGKK